MLEAVVEGFLGRDAGGLQLGFVLIPQADLEKVVDVVLLGRKNLNSGDPIRPASNAGSTGLPNRAKRIQLGGRFLL